MTNYKDIDDKYVAHTYARFPLCISEGKGSYVYDEAKTPYLDFTSGIGVNSLGYAYPAWVDAITKQANTLAHISNLYYTNPMLEVAKSLCTRTKMNRFFFANSGAEANEAAIKVARKYASVNHPSRNTIITLTQSFHGRTITTLSATGQDSFHQDFHPFTQGFRYVEANNINDLVSKVNADVLAIMIEIVQGEGGVIPLQKEFINEINKICTQNDILLIVDEVQTGIGRCGTLFAYEQYALKPNIVSTAKGLGNGLPIGGILLDEKCQDVFTYGDHGTTFGGNPIACAGAKVVLDTIDDAFLKKVASKGSYIQKRLLAMPHVQSVHGLGMMIGVSLDIDAKEVLLACMKQGLLFLTAKTNLRLLPPLTMTIDEIDKGLTILENTLKGWK